MDYATLKKQPIVSVRNAIRDGRYTAHTAGLAAGFYQANLVIMQEVYALDFMRFCQRNPKPCPLTAVSDTGNPMMFTLGHDIDIRTDVPVYTIYRDGRAVETVTDIESIWQDDLVAFALGCSFTFEHALLEAGISLGHIENNSTVPMFRSNLETVAAGSFSGNMVVSMRAIPANEVERVTDISRRYPLAHGGPVHIGSPGEIGIVNINLPDWGDPVPVLDEHVPMFWACGVTPQVAIEHAKLPLCITHKPGHMLITDIPEHAEIPII